MNKALCSALVSVLVAALLVVTPSPSSATVQIEGFESAVPTGWTVTNNSSPLGSKSVIQGDIAAFPAQQGAPTSYAAMNLASTTGVGTISTWLITPKYTDLSNGDAWAFFTRTADPVGTYYPDRLEVRMSSNGGCSPGAGSSSVGDFTTLLATINPDLAWLDYPFVWTQYSGTLTGMSGAMTGCIAFRYFVTNAGLFAANANYIGIDTYSFDDQPADTTPPDTSITSGPEGSTVDATPTFAFTSTETGSTFQCRIDAAAYQPCSGAANHTTSALSDGAHTFAVRAVDTGGNPDPTPATRAFTVDTTAPDTEILSGPDGPTPEATPTFGFASTESDSTFACSVDGAAYGACTAAGSHTTATLADGDHSFAVRATDTTSHTDASPATRSFRVDTLAPDTSIISGPDGLTNDSTPTLGVGSTEEGSSFECSLDQAEFSPCLGPEVTMATELIDGDHVVAVRAVDAAGNVDPTPSVREFTIDTVAPGAGIETAPAYTQDTTPTFQLTAEDDVSTYECSLDDAEFTVCSGPESTYTSPVLADGPHSLAVRATDLAGNVDLSAAQVAFTVDTAAPDTTIGSGPTGATPDSTPTFAFTSTETGTTYECSLDGAAYAACSGPGDQHTTDVLDDGFHSLAVRATDLAGNVDLSAAQVGFTVDTTVPDTTIVSGPTGATSDSTPTFAFTSTEADSTFECSLDGATYAACSGPGNQHTTAALALGQHTFVVRATDRVGHADVIPAFRSFSVIKPAPDCSAAKTSVTRAKAAATKATAALTKATKKLKAIKRTGTSKAIARAKKVVTVAATKVRIAKRTLADATKKLTTCQGG